MHAIADFFWFNPVGVHAYFSLLLAPLALLTLSIFKRMPLSVFFAGIVLGVLYLGVDRWVTADVAITANRLPNNHPALVQLRAHQAEYAYDKVRAWDRYWDSRALPDEQLMLELAAESLDESDPLRERIAAALASGYVSLPQFEALRAALLEQRAKSLD